MDTPAPIGAYVLLVCPWDWPGGARVAVGDARRPPILKPYRNLSSAAGL